MAAELEELKATIKALQQAQQASGGGSGSSAANRPSARAAASDAAGGGGSAGSTSDKPTRWGLHVGMPVLWATTDEPNIHWVGRVAAYVDKGSTGTFGRKGHKWTTRFKGRYKIKFADGDEIVVSVEDAYKYVIAYDDFIGKVALGKLEDGSVCPEQFGEAPSDAARAASLAKARFVI